MIELRRCLSERQNILARLFHIELKDLVKKGLEIMEKMPVPGVKEGNLECYNSRILVDIRNNMLAHVADPVIQGRNGKIVEQIFNFVTMLYDSDEAWRRMIYQVILRVKEAEFKPEEEPRLEYWRQ